MGNAWIVDAVRTPRGRGRAGKGALSGIHPQELLKQAIDTLIERTSIDASLVDDVISGVVTPYGEQGAVLARNSVLSSAKLPLTTTGVTLNRFCGSGLQAVNFGAMAVMSGAQDCVISGGAESMSRVPMGSDQAGIDGNNAELRKKHFQVAQGISADLIATLEGFSREELDKFALASQQKAEIAQKEGYFRKSLFSVKDAAGNVVLEADEHPRHGTTLEALSGLKPAFEEYAKMPVTEDGRTSDQVALERYTQISEIKHLHTGGNSSGIVDGACGVLLASDDFIKAHGVKPRAKIRAMATIGAEPLIMLTAPAPASLKALKKAGMNASDIDLWEINEAFATVPLETIKKLGIDPAKVNVNGGAIALGHPLGATGAMLLNTAVDELERRGLATALITLCIGGGMGIATIIERV